MSSKLKRVLLFILITFVFSWGLFGVYSLLGGSFSFPAFLILGSLYMFCPALAVLVLKKIILKENFNDLAISFKLNRWFLLAWLLPLVLTFATVAINLLMPDIQFSTGMEDFYRRFNLTQEQLELTRQQAAALPLHPFWLLLIQGLVAGISVNAIFGFGEELGWRGFLIRETSILGFWKSSLVIGVIWGLWHAPLILKGHNYPEHPVAGVFLMILWTTLLSPIFSFVRIKSGSVIAASILHSSLNAVAGLSQILIRGGDDITSGITGIPGFISLAVANFGILAYQRYAWEKPLELIK